MAKPAYRRILIKLSGEALLGNQPYGVDPEACSTIASSIQEISKIGVQVGVVIGGGNIFRGVKGVAAGMERTPADHVGMLATLINGISLQQAFEKIHSESRIMTAIACPPAVAEPYSWKDALQYLDEGVVLIFVGGTGNPYFTTDSAAALRALEIRAEVLLKATTKVDGVYDKDPLKHPDAKKFERLSYSEVLAQNLQVMDGAAVALCRENRIPIRVFNVFSDRALMKAVCDQSAGTLVEG